MSCVHQAPASQEINHWRLHYHKKSLPYGKCTAVGASESTADSSDVACSSGGRCRTPCRDLAFYVGSFD